jgi:hypothetical protein
MRLAITDLMSSLRTYESITMRNRGARSARDAGLRQMLLTTRFASRSSKTSARQASVLGSTLERSQRPRQEMPHWASDRKSSGSSSTDTPRRVSAAATSASVLQRRITLKKMQLRAGANDRPGRGRRLLQNLRDQLKQLRLRNMHRRGEGGSAASGRILITAEQFTLLGNNGCALGHVVALSGNNFAISRFCCRNSCRVPWHVLVLQAPTAIITANTHFLESVLHKGPFHRMPHAADSFDFRFDVRRHDNPLVVQREQHDVAQPPHAIDGNADQA